MDCYQVADYVLWRAGDKEGSEGISNLKLQKLVYYCQGFHLAILGQPLFGEEIVAWQHGPVVPALYHRYKEFAAGPITPPEDFNPLAVPSDSADVMDEVCEVFGQFSAWRLRDMTHIEPTWREAWESTAAGEDGIIPKTAMLAYFKTRLK